MEAFAIVETILEVTFGKFTQTSSAFYWWHLLIATVIAMLFYVTHATLKERYGSLLSYVFPRKVYTHRSAILDYQYLIINGLIMYGLYQFITIDKPLFQNLLHGWFSDHFSNISHTAPTLVEQILISIGALLVFDFSVYLNHYLFHKVRWLWQFHRLHHSAKVLTPFTMLRIHPVEMLGYMLIVSFFGGSYMGIILFWYGGYEELLISWILIPVNFAFFCTYNLHHSHIYLRWPWHLHTVFYSPAHHQIHHSQALKHADKNIGVMFTFWDRLFGTYFEPPKQEPSLRLGVYNEPNLHRTLWEAYSEPFISLYRKIKYH